MGKRGRTLFQEKVCVPFFPLRYHSSIMKQAQNAPAFSLTDLVARTLRKDVLQMSAYHVPDAAGMMKLDAMENPYSLPASLREELGQLAANAPLNRYPDPEASRLRLALKASMHVPDGMELLLGNGSDELIQLLALACARPGTTMLGLEPSFAMYAIVARTCGLKFVGVPLGRDFSLDTEAVITALQRHTPAIVFIAYPNNPTGNLFDATGIERIIRSAPGIVVVDEAYHPFAQASFIPRLPEFPNLLVMRTLSKLGLAGLRLGALVGQPAWIAELNKLRLPYNVSTLTQLVATHVLSREEVLEQQADAIRTARGQLLDRLLAIDGVEAYASAANFILLRVAGAETVYEALRNRGVLIKKLAGSHPSLADCLRVTVGTAAENEAFLEALTQATSP
jgi:histidinol-phosphate aminotransferase